MSSFNSHASNCYQNVILVPLSTPTQLPKAVQERRDSQLAEIPANLQERRGSTVSQTLYFELTFMVFYFSQLSLMFPTRNSRLLRFHDLNISRHTQKFMPVDFFLASASVRAFPTSSESNRRYVMDSVIRNTNVILTQFVKSIYLFFPAGLNSVPQSLNTLLHC